MALPLSTEGVCVERNRVATARDCFAARPQVERVAVRGANTQLGAVTDQSPPSSDVAAYRWAGSTIVAMHNVITARRCRRFGISQTTVRGAMRCCLVQLSHGIYVATQRCARHPEFAVLLDDEEQLRLRADQHGLTAPDQRATLRRQEVLGTIDAYGPLNEEDILALTSAAVVHRLPLIGSARPIGPQRRRSDGGPERRTRGLALGDPGAPVQIQVWNPHRTYHSKWLVRRQSVVDDADAEAWNSFRITSPIRTCLDLARAGTAFDGVAALDQVLGDAMRAGGTDALARAQSIVADAMSRASGSSGIGRARDAADAATGLAESPAESIALLWFRIFDIEGVSQQAVLRDPSGTFVARVDFLITQPSGRRTVIEVDGALKYRAPTMKGGNPLFEEKQREDRIRRLGLGVVRLTWSDLRSGDRVRSLLREAGIAC